jgi:hypothetical protein
VKKIGIACPHECFRSGRATSFPWEDGSILHEWYQRDIKSSLF